MIIALTLQKTRAYVSPIWRNPYILKNGSRSLQAAISRRLKPTPIYFYYGLRIELNSLTKWPYLFYSEVIISARGC